MSFFLQYPAMLGLLALAGMPILIHLLSRARPPEYRFSNIEFLRRVMRRTARIRKPKDWLLLALRTLALAALAAAFISPVLISKTAALPGESSTVVILIDRSASMAARGDSASRFETACADAARFLEKARPSAANLVWIDAEPSAVFPEPGPNLTFLTDQLKTAEPRPETGALAAAFDLALRQLANVSGHSELIIISDFQASAWRDFQPTMPQGIKVRTHRVATTAPANLAITRLLSQPSEPVIGQEIIFLASARNFSKVPVRTQLTLDVDGSRQTQDVDLSPWGETEVAFSLRPATAGQIPVSASITADGFPGDDMRHSVLRVRDAIRVVNSEKSDIIRKLIHSLPWLETTASPSAGDIVATSNWSESEPPDSGITILIHDPFAISPTALSGLLGLNADTEESARGWQILPNEEHPAIRLFRSGNFGNPFAGTFRKRLHLPSELCHRPDFHAIASYADGVPAIFEISGETAPILFFNLPLDPAHSDWAVQGSFLPAFAEIILRTRPSTGIEAAHAIPGSRLSHVSTDPFQSGSIQLLAPDGKVLETDESTTSDGILWQCRETARPGLYRWQISGQTISLTAVVFPDSESDLRLLDETPSFGGTSTGGDSLTRQAALSRGLPLWPWLAAAALGCLLVENLVHLHHHRPTAA